MKILLRCSSVTRPNSIILLSGDSDFIPVFEHIRSTAPDIHILVASFSEGLSGYYWPGNMSDIEWEFPPLTLDTVVREFNPNAAPPNPRTAA